ncbi:hypothetical protein WMY93_031696 [Mugilogobius chulae]|uniref:Secreted protein n=1 Tax=Mugilogobius chulae TaxID=88201 RepID=A0AAW0MM63_9GOBI
MRCSGLVFLTAYAPRANPITTSTNTAHTDHMTPPSCPFDDTHWLIRAPSVQEVWASALLLRCAEDTEVHYYIQLFPRLRVLVRLPEKSNTVSCVGERRISVLLNKVVVSWSRDASQRNPYIGRTARAIDHAQKDQINEKHWCRV